MSNPVKELLQQAKSVFEDHGGAVGVFQEPDGTVCAIGALHEASGLDAYGVTVVSSSSEHLWPAQMVLNQSARSLYGFEHPGLISPAVHVNDILGQAAVLSLYDHAIKTAGDGVNP